MVADTFSVPDPYLTNKVLRLASRAGFVVEGGSRTHT